MILEPSQDAPWADALKSQFFAYRILEAEAEEKVR